MAMEIKPSIYEGPIVRADDQTGIDAAPDKKSGEKEANAATGNAQTSSNTGQAMKQAGTEMKGTIKTGEHFLQQALSDQLDRNVRTELLGWPKSQDAGQNSATAACPK